MSCRYYTPSLDIGSYSITLEPNICHITFVKLNCHVGIKHQGCQKLFRGGVVIGQRLWSSLETTQIMENFFNIISSNLSPTCSLLLYRGIGMWGLWGPSTPINHCWSLICALFASYMRYI